jgi:hypothetical protein
MRTLYCSEVSDGGGSVIKYWIIIAVPVTVAERSKALTVYAGADAGTVGSNSTQGMDV